jgi:hypothetical protein
MMINWLVNMTVRTIHVGFALLVLLWLCSGLVDGQDNLNIPIEDQRSNTEFIGIPQCFPNDNSYLYAVVSNYVTKARFTVILACRYTDNVTQTFYITPGGNSNPRRISPSSGSVVDRECNMTLTVKEPGSGNIVELQNWPQTCGSEDPNLYAPTCVPSDSDCNCKSEARCPWYDPFCALFDNSLQRDPVGMFLLTLLGGGCIWIAWTITVTKPEDKKEVMIRRAAKMASDGQLQTPMEDTIKSQPSPPPNEVKLEANNNIQPYSGGAGGHTNYYPLNNHHNNSGDVQTF